jgi:cephalosporin-C deacetylase
MPNAFQPTTVRPDDFDAYWADVLQELQAMPIAPEETELPLRSTEFCTAYEVRFTSLGPYRLFGYLSVPNGEGPFPTQIYLSPYQSVVGVMPLGEAIEKRGRFVTFALAARGQRNADKPYAAAFPGMLTDGIDDPQSYIFRGFVADCCRAVDYLLTRPEVDQTRLAAVVANELSLLTAALRPELTHIVATPALFYATMDQLPQTDIYPLEEINDYLRLYPNRREAVSRTLAYFEPLFFAPSVRIPTLLWGNPGTIAPLAEAVDGQVEVREPTYSSYQDGLYQEEWLARQFGFEEAILPAHWQRD